MELFLKHSHISQYVVSQYISLIERIQSAEVECQFQAAQSCLAVGATEDLRILPIAIGIIQFCIAHALY